MCELCGSLSTALSALHYGKISRTRRAAPTLPLQLPIPPVSRTSAVRTCAYATSVNATIVCALAQSPLRLLLTAAMDVVSACACACATVNNDYLHHTGALSGPNDLHDAARDRSGRRKSNNPKKVHPETPPDSAKRAAAHRLCSPQHKLQQANEPNQPLQLPSGLDHDGDADDQIDNACGVQLCSDSKTRSRTNSSAHSNAGANANSANTNTNGASRNVHKATSNSHSLGSQQQQQQPRSGASSVSLLTGAANVSSSANAPASDRDRDRNLTALVRIATLRLAREATPITNARVQDAVIDLESRYSGENRKIFGDKIKKRLLRIGCAFDHANSWWSPGAEIEAALANTNDNSPDWPLAGLSSRLAADGRELEPGEIDLHFKASLRKTQTDLDVSTCTSASECDIKFDLHNPQNVAQPDPAPSDAAHPPPPPPPPPRESDADVKRMPAAPTSTSPAGSANDITVDDPLLTHVSTLLEELHASSVPVSVPAIRARLPCRVDQKTMSDRIRRRLLMLGYTYDALTRTYTRPAHHTTSHSHAAVAAVSPPVCNVDEDDELLAIVNDLLRKHTKFSVVVTTAGIREELRRAVPTLGDAASYDQATRERLNRLVRSQLSLLGYAYDALTETWQLDVQTVKPAAVCPAPTLAQLPIKQPDEINEGLTRTRHSSQSVVSYNARSRRCSSASASQGSGTVGEGLMAAANLTPMVEGIVRTWTSERRLFTVQDVRRTLIVAERKYKRCDRKKLTKRISRQLRQLGCRYDASEEKWRLVVPGRFRTQPLRDDEDEDDEDAAAVENDRVSRSDSLPSVNGRSNAMSNCKLDSMDDTEADVLLGEARLTPLIRAAIERLLAQPQPHAITCPGIIEQLVRIDDRYSALDRKVLRNRIGYRLQYKLGYRFDPDGEFWLREPLDGAPLPRRTRAKLALQLANTHNKLEKSHADQHGALDLTARSQRDADSSGNDSENNCRPPKRTYSDAEYEAAVRQIARMFSDPASPRKLTIREVANELAERGMRYHHSKVSDMLKRIGCRFNASLNVWTVHSASDDGAVQTAPLDTAGEMKNGLGLALPSAQASAVREIAAEMNQRNEPVTKDKVAVELQRRGIEVGSGLLNELLHRAGYAYSEQKRRWVRHDDFTVPTKAYRNRNSFVLKSAWDTNGKAHSPSAKAKPITVCPNATVGTPLSLVNSLIVPHPTNGLLATLNAASERLVGVLSLASRQPVFKNLPVQTTVADLTSLPMPMPMPLPLPLPSVPLSPKRARVESDCKPSTSPAESHSVALSCEDEAAAALRRKNVRANARAALPTLVGPAASNTMQIDSPSDDEIDVGVD